MSCIFSAVSVFAGEISETRNLGGFILTCGAKCTQTNGKATTSGAANPYKNYASVIIYGQNGNSQGTISGYGSNGYTATASKKWLKPSLCCDISFSS